MFQTNLLCTRIYSVYLIKNNSNNYKKKSRRHLYSFTRNWSEVPEALTVYIILTGEVPCSQHCRQNGTLQTRKNIV